MEYTKKPITVQAWTAEELSKCAFDSWVNMPTEVAEAYEKGGWVFLGDGSISIPTLEGTMKADPDDMVIMGVNGEFYPCKPDIFEKTYTILLSDVSKPDDVDAPCCLTNMTFGQAYTLVDDGCMVTRKGWNGKDMFIFKRPADTLLVDFIGKVKSLPDSVKEFLTSQGKDVEFTAYLCIFTADGKVVNGWRPTQLDMDATDWYALPPYPTLMGC